jgi:uncharacterized membrane protein
VIGLVRFVYLLALVVWLGEVVFFSFVVAPVVFGVLGAAQAGDVVGAIFPRYYALGAVSALAAVGSGVLLARRAAARGRWAAAVVVLSLGAAATLWAGGVVHPRAQRLRAAMHAAGEDASAGEEFRRAHRLAVVLNGGVLLAGIVGLGLSAAALRE